MADRRLAVRLSMVLAAVGFLGVGCGPRTEQGTPSVGGTGGGYPVVVQDAQGQSVRVERRPERIVSVAPTVTEIVFALGSGDRLVAVTDQCNYPVEARGLPRVGGWFTPSIEKVLAAEPDLVIGSRGNPPDFVTAVRRSGCPVLTIDPRTMGGIFAAVQDIGRVIGADADAEGLTGEMRARLAVVADRVAGVPLERRPTAFIVLQVGPLWTAGSDTFQDDAIRAAGGRNIAADRDGFVLFGTESLMRADPDFLLLSTMEGDPDRMKREVLANPVLKRLTAVREGRAVVLEADPIMRPGPRIVEAVEAMARAFYAGRPGRPEEGGRG